MIFGLRIYLAALFGMTLAHTFKPNENFDIYYINLERAKERREYMECILNQAKCKYTRFEAVDGKLLRDNIKTVADFSCGIDVKYVKDGIKESLQKIPGTVGCTLSHLILHNMIAKSKSDKPVVIFEDDIKIQTDFVDQIEHILTNFKEEWDIILISARITFDYSAPLFVDTKLRKIHGFIETYGYMVNGSKSADKVAKYIEKCPWDLPVDDYLKSLAEKRLLKFYARWPPLCSQYPEHLFPSDIETSNKYKHDYHIENPLNACLIDYQERRKQLK